MSVFAGEEATGKTFFLLGIIAHFLKQKDAEAIIYESESAISTKLLKERGIDVDRCGVQPVVTVEESKTEILRTLQEYRENGDDTPLLIALDSLGMLSTVKEIEDTSEGKNVRDMTKAQLMKGMFRVLTLAAGQANVPIIMTNHVYAVIGNMFPSKEMSGGSGLKYAASTIVFLSKKKDKDTATNEVVGDIIHCKLEKSRFTRPFKQVDVHLSYKDGLNRYYYLEVIAAKHGVFKKLDTRYELPDGRKVFGKNLKEDPESYYTKEVLDRIDEACKTEFLYGEDDDLPEDEEKMKEIKGKKTKGE